MTLTKPCEHCGTEFPKPKTCGLPEWSGRRFCSAACKKAAQVGQPNKSKGIPRGETAPRLPCRICGEPTKYLASMRHLADRVPCERPECVEASRQLKNERIGATAREKYATGERQKVRHSWENVSRVSVEETALAPWFEAHGWESQFIVLTGVHTNKLPRQFHLDFALPDRKFYVEIDGSVHRLRKERDARRDAMLAERGWTGLRLPAALVASDVDAAIHRITSWLADQADIAA